VRRPGRRERKRKSDSDGVGFREYVGLLHSHYTKMAWGRDSKCKVNEVRDQWQKLIVTRVQEAGENRHGVHWILNYPGECCHKLQASVGLVRHGEIMIVRIE
jgi:hypothetical protein